MALSEDQKRTIKLLLIENKPTPGNVTMGETIRKKLKMSKDDFEKIGDDVENYLIEFFESRSSNNNN